MKSRYINTSFWSDPFIIDLTPDEKLLFLYFLTNERTNISGIYELSLRIASFETGISEDRIGEILLKFENKILHFNNFIIIKNFYKHQQRNPKITSGIAYYLKELPPKVVMKLHEIRFPIKDLIDRSKPKDKFENVEGEVLKQETKRKDVNGLLDIFFAINPEIKYGNTTQRKILEDLIKKHGYDELEKIINFAISINGEKYAPTVTNPLDLRDKFAKVIFYYQKKLANQPIIAT